MNKIWTALIAMALVFGLAAFAGCAKEEVVEEEKEPGIVIPKEKEKPPIVWPEEKVPPTLEEKLAEAYAGTIIENIAPNFACLQGIPLIGEGFMNFCLNFGSTCQGLPCVGVGGLPIGGGGEGK